MIPMPTVPIKDRDNKIEEFRLGLVLVGLINMGYAEAEVVMKMANIVLKGKRYDLKMATRDRSKYFEKWIAYWKDRGIDWDPFVNASITFETNTPETFKRDEVAALFREFCDNILHGDEYHEKWLKEETEKFLIQKSIVKKEEQPETENS